MTINYDYFKILSLFGLFALGSIGFACKADSTISTKTEKKLEKLIYLQDPYCGWCYGFSPSMAQVEKKYGAQLDIELVNGGLWPGERAQAMTAELTNMITSGGQRITALSGQVFSDTFAELLGTAGFLYDTEPVSKAAIAVRQLAPEKEFPFIRAAQKAFFVAGKDPNKVETFVDLMDDLGIDKTQFLSTYSTPKTAALLQQDFEKSSQLGVSGFPTLLYVNKNGQATAIARGYSSFEEVSGRIDGLLTQK